VLTSAWQIEQRRINKCDVKQPVLQRFLRQPLFRDTAKTQPNCLMCLLTCTFVLLTLQARLPPPLTLQNPSVLPTQWCVWISEQTAIISLYSVNGLVFITETECVYCAVRTGSLTFNNSTFCPHSVFMCFVWISEQTAIISLYNINWLVFITEPECVYCAHTVYLCVLCGCECGVCQDSWLLHQSLSDDCRS
jgi:hypothetical protein